MKPRIQQFQYLFQGDRTFIPSKALIVYPICSRRAVHTSGPKNASAASSHSAILSAPSTQPTAQQHVARNQPTKGVDSPLSILPTSQIVRTYLITRLSSSPTLLNLTFSILNRLLSSKSALTSIDRNPFINWLLKRTFYAQFCAGENKAEVQRTVARMRNVGYNGVILEYALEWLQEKNKPGPDSPITKKEIATWRKGMLETVEMAREGDFVGLKWSGLGQHALSLLKANNPPTPPMHTAIHEVCAAASTKRVGLLPGAEEEITNAGIDAWTLRLQQQYNKPGAAPIMYTTFQALLRSTPANLARHLASARQNGHVLGVKLVRGAYMAHEPKSAVWGSKEETDRAYDGLAAALLRREYGGVLQPARSEESGDFTAVDVVLASHNVASIRKATKIRQEQLEAGEERMNVAFAQLMGMADEVGCELLAAGRTAREENMAEGKEVRDVPRAIKCTTWGTTSECLNFLLRRAAENKDAATRTEESRRAMGREIRRRCRGVVGLA